MLRLSGKAVAATTLLPRISFGARQNKAPSYPGVVASEAPVAAVGQQILESGGNAVDAVVGASLAAGVLIPSKAGLGGYGGAMTLALANGTVTSIDFNSVAPAAARPDMFELDARGNVIGRKNFHGWLAAGVPGVCGGVQLALTRYGSKSLRELLQPAIRLAQTIRKKDNYVNFSTLAKTLTALAERNSMETFYRGDIGQEIADTFQKNGGLVTSKDLAAYQAREVAPYQLTWGDYTIYTAPLGACGLLPLEALSILKAMKWDKEKFSPGEALHARVEALRLAWKDRAEFFGDPSFTDVPVRKLLSEDYGLEQAARVKSAVKEKKPLSLKLERIEQIGTLNISAVDSHGNFATMTLTQGSSYGAQVSINSLGIVLGQGMARFDPRPGHPNSIAPGKRPVHNMAPCILLKDNKPIVAVGAAGGNKIPNSLYDFFSHYIGRGKTMEQSLEAPRMNCIGLPEVALEKNWPKAEADYLRTIGFKISTSLGAVVSGVTVDPKTNMARGKTRMGNPFQENSPGAGE